MIKLSSDHHEEWKAFTEEEFKIIEMLNELELRQEENVGQIRGWWGKIGGIYDLDQHKKYRIDSIGRLSENI